MADLTITVVNREMSDDCADAKNLLQACVVKALNHMTTGGVATIYVNSRNEVTGWIEFGIRYNYPSGGTLFVAAIQRRRGTEFEFCS